MPDSVLVTAIRAAERSATSERRREEPLPSAERVRIPPRPTVVAGMAPAGRDEVLVIGRRLRPLVDSLLAAGCPASHVDTLDVAGKLIRKDVYRVVVVEPDVAGEDGVAFAVGAKGGMGPGSAVGPHWSAIPFVITPLVGETEFVVYRGFDDFIAVAPSDRSLLHSLLDLFWRW